MGHLLEIHATGRQRGLVDPWGRRDLPSETHLAAIGKLLDADGDGESDPLTDAIVIWRWLFGFTGDVLVAGAVDLAHCTRCDASAIDGYLDALAH